MSKTLASAFLLTQDAINNPVMDGTNPHFNSKFASLGSHLDAILPVANANGLIVTQEPVSDNGTLALRTRVIHSETGEFYESTMPLAVDKPGPQGMGSAITYARRYALASIFGVVGEADDDGNAAHAPKPARAGTVSSEAAVTRADAPAPAADTSPTHQAIQKAQEAHQRRKEESRPGTPYPTGRTTSKGDTIYEVITHVERWQDKATKDGRPVYVFGVNLEGNMVEMTTMNDQTRDEGTRLEKTTARVEYVENGRFKNLWGVKEIPAVTELAGQIAEEDIPFAWLDSYAWDGFSQTEWSDPWRVA